LNRSFASATLRQHGFCRVFPMKISIQSQSPELSQKVARALPNDDIKSLKVNLLAKFFGI